MVWFVRGRWLIRRWLVKRWLKMSSNRRLGRLGFYMALVVSNNNVVYEDDKISSIK